MSGDNLPPIIIVKKVKKVAAGHHGGAWKVAYADFVTAMMAFFLLLWLLNATTEDQKRGISDYFAPASAAKTTSGSGGVLGGLTVSAEGAMRNTTTPAGVSEAAPSFTGEATQKVENEDQETGGGGGPKEIDEKDLEELLAEREQNEFVKAEAQLRRAIRESPELRQLKENLIIEMTPEGMRIQIIDQAGLALFPLGSSQMFGHTRRLLQQVARVIDKLPNDISISGHTDATPYSSANGYGNWELSTDRANASRRMLIEFGLSPERIAKVIGKADREHLFPDDPTSPRNRRIGIVLLRGTGQYGGTDRRPRPNNGIPAARPLPSSRG